MTITELWVDRSDFRKTKTVRAEKPTLADGEVLLAIDKFAVTSNNIGYAVSGDMLGYWNYFPTGNDSWGKVTVWGFADVVESRTDSISAGERIYGFFPMSSHVIMQPDNVNPNGFIDAVEHRQQLHAFYNMYQRCDADPEALKSIENERCIFFPLFGTGFIIADFLLDNSWFSADQILIGSVSSKTGIGLAKFIKTNGYSGKVVGLTSLSNRGFVKGLGLCDQVATYDDLNAIKPISSVYVDMSGDTAVRSGLHHHLEDNMKSSQIVGATHWDSERKREPLPGAAPEFFFTPAHIAKREQEWGPGVLWKKAGSASAELAMALKNQMTLERIEGADAAADIWRDMLDNKVSGSRGIMISL